MNVVVQNQPINAVNAQASRVARARVKIQRKSINGVLILDKPIGMSSNQALQKVKWLLSAQKAGHTGTLDPLATGVLPICFGAATKFSHLHLQADKSYVALLRLGETTTTQDAEGEVLERVDCGEMPITRSLLEQLAAKFTGSITQVPPMFSALKVGGRALYELAREGVEVERQSRSVHIQALELRHLQSSQEIQEYLQEHAPNLDVAALNQPPQIQTDKPILGMKVHCSKGTYIRTLGHDIGQALGSGGHLVFLRRTQTGSFHLNDCVTLPALEQLNIEDRQLVLKPVESLLCDHISVHLNAEDSKRFLSGLPRRGDWQDMSEVAVFADDPKVLLGTARTCSGELIPERLLNSQEIQSILESSS